MQSANRVFALALGIALAACATTSQPERQSQRDPDANIAGWSTFGWGPAALDEGGEDTALSMLDTNIRKAIVAELSRRGYTEVESDPQFLITYEISAQEKVKSSPFQIGIGMGSWGGSGGGGVSVGSQSMQSYREGRLVIHAIDAAANKEVWYGSISKALEQRSVEAEDVARVVALTMQDFPVRSTQ